MWPYDPEVDDFFAPLPEDARPVLYFDVLKDAIAVFFGTGEPALVRGNAVDEEALRTFLQALKTVSDKYGLAAKGSEGTGGRMGYGSNLLMFTMTGTMTCYLDGRAVLGTMLADNVPMLNDPFENRAGSKLAVFPGLSQGAYTPVLLTGVNAASSQKELALSFVQLMLGEQVQSTAIPGGIPTTKAGVAAQVAAYNERAQRNREEGDESAVPYAADIDGLIAQLKTPVQYTHTVESAFFDAARDYCGGKTTLDAAVQSVKQAMSLLLSERS